jgi:hypothetical protein
VIISKEARFINIVIYPNTTDEYVVFSVAVSGRKCQYGPLVSGKSKNDNFPSIRSCYSFFYI